MSREGERRMRARIPKRIALGLVILLALLPSARYSFS